MVSLIQNILRKNLETNCRVFLAKTSQDDSESTDVGFERFTDSLSSPVSITSVPMLVVYDI